MINYSVITETTRIIESKNPDQILVQGNTGMSLSMVFGIPATATLRPRLLISCKLKGAKVLLKIYKFLRTVVVSVYLNL